jgi:hypothetical protein
LVAVVEVTWVVVVVVVIAEFLPVPVVETVIVFDISVLVLEKDELVGGGSETAGPDGRVGCESRRRCFCASWKSKVSVQVADKKDLPLGWGNAPFS